jgi:hypothetical protein
VPGLGDRDTWIAPAKLGDERPDDAALGLQRVNVAQQHVQRERRDIHSV